MSAAGGNFWGFEDLKCRISFTKMHFSISNPLKNFACGGLFMFGFLYKTNEIGILELLGRDTDECTVMLNSLN